MPSSYKHVVISASIGNPLGHHEVHSYIEETTDTGEVIKGVSEVHGIDAQALVSQFGGDTEQWRQYVAGLLLTSHKLRQSIHAEVVQWRGKSFDITEPQ